MAPKKTRRRQAGYAVIGLGHIAQTAVLPAFRHAGNSKLVALVSSDEHKRPALSKNYRAGEPADLLVVAGADAASRAGRPHLPPADPRAAGGRGGSAGAVATAAAAPRGTSPFRSARPCTPSPPPSRPRS